MEVSLQGWHKHFFFFFPDLRVKSLNSGCQKVKVGVIFVHVIAHQERISLNLGRNVDLN